MLVVNNQFVQIHNMVCRMSHSLQRAPDGCVVRVRDARGLGPLDHAEEIAGRILATGGRAWFGLLLLLQLLGELLRGGNLRLVQKVQKPHL